MILPIATDFWAQVAELVDALASGASGRMVVEVRVFSWAPLFPQKVIFSHKIKKDCAGFRLWGYL